VRYQRVLAQHAGWPGGPVVDGEITLAEEIAPPR
jgi:hypothetical protein